MKYVIGVDFGTLSARALLVEAESGKEVSSFTSEYEHGVLEQALPTGVPLYRDASLQVPSDYVKALSESVKGALNAAKIDKGEVVALGIDFTASTILPIDKNGNPLCESEKYRNEPHAYVKLWKHHGANIEAEEISEVLKRMDAERLKAYGGKLSSELMLPKILETLHRAPELYRDTYRFIEAADWISLLLTGKESASPVFAGYKALWSSELGYPKKEILAAIDPALSDLTETKLRAKVEPSIHGMAGRLTEKGAEICGLPVGTAVALPMIDAHSSMAGLNVTGNGDLVMIIGTSTCHIMNSTEKRNVEGISGYVKDGVFPGLYTYEAGQSGSGDMFEWYVKNALPAAYEREAKERGMGVHALLREKASKLKVGESGLIALDWWSGNRSILSDSSLTGLICGFTLKTRPEEIYRALIEATAFGARVIHEQLENSGLKIERITATGGIANKDEMMMQIYADVLGKPIRIAKSSYSGALGSAVYAAAAAGLYPTIADAAKAFGKPYAEIYNPIPENTEVYNELYKKYRALYNGFGAR